MKTLSLVIVSGIALAMCSGLAAQTELPKPDPAHGLLQKFVGDWISHSEMTTTPDQPATKAEGEMKSRMLGEFWLVNEISGEMDGMKINAVQTIGYDPSEKKYIGTWVDSILSHQWAYEGTLDASGKSLTLEAEGPDLTGSGKTAKFRDVYTFVSEKEIRMVSSMQGDDGKWIEFGTSRLTRK